jgi:hypothetical protein
LLSLPWPGARNTKTPLSKLLAASVIVPFSEPVKDV